MRKKTLLYAAMWIVGALTIQVTAQQTGKPTTSQNKTGQNKTALSKTAQNKTATTPAKKSPTAADVEYIVVPRPQPPPFSDVVRVGNMLYLSGQLGVDDQGVLVTGGIKAETKQVLERIRRLLEQNNSSMSNVVKCTCMLLDMSEWGAMNEVYVTYFEKDRRPARSAFGVSGLARNARVEIECMATVK